MEVKGILVRGTDGQEYLVGIGPRATGVQTERPTIWRVTGASFESLEETRTASSTIRDRLELQSPPQSGQTHDEHVKQAAIEAVAGFLTQFFQGSRW